MIRFLRNTRYTSRYLLSRAMQPINKSVVHPSFIREIHIPFRLADIGEGIAEVEIIEWHVKEGDTVGQFDPICEVQSDKANVEITSRYDGEIVSVAYEIGDMAKVGEPLVIIDIPDSQNDDVHHKEQEDGGTNTIKDESESESYKLDSNTLRADKKQVHYGGIDGKVLTTPAVRRLLKENDISSSEIKPTGKNGRLLKEDVLKFITDRSNTSKYSASKEAPFETSSNSSNNANTITTPVKGLTRLMIQSMTESMKIPHFGYSDEYQFDALHDAKTSLAPQVLENGSKLTYLPLILKAASMGLKAFPQLNSSLSSDECNIITHLSHNIGVAMDTPRGLVVPVVHNVENMTIVDIAERLTTLQELGAQNKLGSKDLSGGTFTLSNIGVIGGTYTSPVIVAPQVAIGAFGKIQILPRYNDMGELKPTRIVNFSFSADHRIVDGVTVAKFSNLMKTYLENPLTMLTSTK